MQRNFISWTILSFVYISGYPWTKSTLNLKIRLLMYKYK